MSPCAQTLRSRIDFSKFLVLSTLPCALCLLLAATVSAQLPGRWGYMFLSHQPNHYVCSGEISVAVQTRFHLLIAVDPGEGAGVFGWEASLDVPSEFLVLSRQGIGLWGPPSFSPDDNFIIGTGSAQFASLDQPFVAVTYTVLIFEDASDLRVTMGAAEPSTPACVGEPCWLHTSERVFRTEPCDLASGFPDWQRGYLIFNPVLDTGCRVDCAGVSTETPSWGALKATYRP